MVLLSYKAQCSMNYNESLPPDQKILFCSSQVVLQQPLKYQQKEFPGTLAPEKDPEP